MLASKLMRSVVAAIVALTWGCASSSPPTATSPPTAPSTGATDTAATDTGPSPATTDTGSGSTDTASASTDTGVTVPALPDGFGASLATVECGGADTSFVAWGPQATFGVRMPSRILEICGEPGHSLQLSIAQPDPVRPLRVLTGTDLNDGALCTVSDGTSTAVVHTEYVVIAGTVDISLVGDTDFCADPYPATFQGIVGEGTATFTDVVVEHPVDGTRIQMGPLVIGPITFDVSHAAR